jgi:hypothetical protein
VAGDDMSALVGDESKPLGGDPGDLTARACASE